jgi:hypothetical protein
LYLSSPPGHRGGAGGYESLALDIRIPATIEYGMEVQDGSAVDALVLREERFAEFEAGDLSETAPMSSLRGTEAGSANGNLMPDTWYVVVDNPGAGAATVTVSYEVTQYIPYGSGRHDDSGP